MQKYKREMVFVNAKYKTVLGLCDSGESEKTCEFKHALVVVIIRTAVMHQDKKGSRYLLYK